MKIKDYNEMMKYMTRPGTPEQNKRAEENNKKLPKNILPPSAFHLDRRPGGGREGEGSELSVKGVGI